MLRNSTAHPASLVFHSSLLTAKGVDLVVAKIHNSNAIAMHTKLSTVEQAKWLRFNIQLL